MTTIRPGLPSLAALAVAAAIGLTACTGAAPTPAAPTDPPAAPPAASASSGGGTEPDGAPTAPGGGVPGDPGSGVGTGPIGPAPVDPGLGEPTIVRPLPGRANPHPVSPIRFETSIDGRHVLVRISWYGGVEPCSVLDSVRIERTANDIALTPIEGSSAGDNVACIDIALLKATIVDLGELEPGTYRISSPGSDAPPAVFTID